ncbi:MAG: LysR family transcriptional regulator [Trueperaceae bacterium]|nr:LysR family transcriptional regulator [Trueperaceae bacterium]
MTTLSPLPQVRSLVAVVAHGRLNRAAEALGLTESAVSHHLRK